MSRRNKDSKSSALEALAAARKSGKKNRYENEDDNLYDYVTEDEYKKLQAERGTEFVVGGSDYEDDGREIYDEEDEGGDKSSSKSKPKKKKLGEKLKGNNKNIKQMFGKANAKAKPARKQKLTGDLGSGGRDF